MRRNTSRYKYSNIRLKLKLIYNINNYDILKDYETAILVVPISLTLSPYSRLQLYELRKACGLLNIYCLINTADLQPICEPFSTRAHRILV